MKTKFPLLLVIAVVVASIAADTLAADGVVPKDSPGAVLRVPGQYATIQGAIDAAKAGESVLAAPGTYRERLKLKPGITVKSEGDDTKGILGLKRAEGAILDGAGGGGPGVEMAAGAVLDGFTVTGVGGYDDALWRRHHATQGNEQPHEPIGGAGTPGIAVAHDCTVANNIVHHAGYTGIAITGAPGRKVAPRIAGNICYRNMGGGIGSMNGSTAVIENNTCFENFYAGIGHSGASPVVRGNTCYGNIRAGIGISEGSSPVVTGNRCYKNRRAGIGIRTGKDTQPVVNDNDCFENDMAGIGVEDGASAKLTGNVCRANKAAGIGLRGKARAAIVKNRITANALVAIGVTGDSEAIITDNELTRDGGVPPMIAVLDDSRAVVTGNTIRGGGVAGVLVKGRAEIRGNRFIGNAPGTKPASDNAVWAHPGSDVTFDGNHVEHWQHAVSASGTIKIVARDNEVSSFTGTAIMIKDSREPARVTGNVAVSDDPGAKVVEISGSAGEVSGNELKRAAAKP